MISARPLSSWMPLRELLRKLDLEIVYPGDSARLMSMVVQPTLLDRIREKQGEDPDLEKIRAQLQ